MYQKELELLLIKPYPNNPLDNRKAVKYCAESIRHFGYRNYILVDANFVIICGHTRYQALRQLGVSHVTVNVADDMTEEQIKAYRLADNKVSEFAKWNPNLLDLELSEIEQLDVSMVEFRFELAELNVIGNEKTIKMTILITETNANGPMRRTIFMPIIQIKRTVFIICRT